MSTDKGEGLTTENTASQPTGRRQEPSTPSQSTTPETPPKLGDEPDSRTGGFERQEAATKEEESADTSPSTPASPDADSRPRQVIAVSASKGPTAFFNLARKFLVTDDTCDLSALEGAIVSAVDAAHLLERSKLATIVRVQTSYVTVEPKRRKQPPPGTPPASQGADQPQPPSSEADIPSTPDSLLSSPQTQQRGGRSSVRELRRARIVITVKRTDSYKRWLEENPLQAIIASDGGTEDDDVHSSDPIQTTAIPNP